MPNEFYEHKRIQANSKEISNEMKFEENESNGFELLGWMLFVRSEFWMRLWREIIENDRISQ